MTKMLIQMALSFGQVDMGMTYDELSAFGSLRKVEKCGPYSMYTQLLRLWGHELAPDEVGFKTVHENLEVGGSY